MVGLNDKVAAIRDVIVGLHGYVGDIETYEDMQNANLMSVINRRKGASVPELDDKICLLVENSPEGYRSALERLIQDHSFREGLGRQAYEHASVHWSPRAMEAKYVDLYRRTMSARAAPSLS